MPTDQKILPEIGQRFIREKVKLNCLKKSLRVGNATQEQVDEQQAIVDAIETNNS